MKNLNKENQLLIDIKKLYTQSILSDFTIITEKNKKFFCHKNILACRSSYFRTYFCESTENEIIFSNIKPKIVDIILNYIYTNELDLSDLTFIDRFNLSQFGSKLIPSLNWKFEIKQNLKKLNDSFLIDLKNLNFKDFLQIIQFFHNEIYLSFPDFFDSVNFGKLSIEKIIEIINIGYENPKFTKNIEIIKYFANFNFEKFKLDDLQFRLIGYDVNQLKTKIQKITDFIFKDPEFILYYLNEDFVKNEIWNKSDNFSENLKFLIQKFQYTIYESFEEKSEDFEFLRQKVVPFDKQDIFGGYTSVGWNFKNKNKQDFSNNISKFLIKDPNAFLFILQIEGKIQENPLIFNIKDSHVDSSIGYNKDISIFFAFDLLIPIDQSNSSFISLFNDKNSRKYESLNQKENEKGLKFFGKLNNQKLKKMKIFQLEFKENNF
ncbi:speckle-type poz protein [Anaeramoeba ignava]|uniref:Speckle-type poz protein n=1 Tax=Anaeramoeba ignava TaxID=1746090 RepID=A0A9Q0R5V3_ANAIG|nr:speckle-type poz protein [Anaeramoeba ignava]